MRKPPLIKLIAIVGIGFALTLYVYAIFWHVQVLKDILLDFCFGGCVGTSAGKLDIFNWSE